MFNVSRSAVAFLFFRHLFCVLASSFDVFFSKGTFWFEGKECPSRDGLRLSEFPDKSKDARVGRVLSLLNAQPWLRASDLAKQVGLSPSRLKDLFRRSTGISIRDYSMDLRLQRARDLLQTTHLSIKEIRVRAGIPNGPNFVREFRKRFKTTP